MSIPRAAPPDLTGAPGQVVKYGAAGWTAGLLTQDNLDPATQIPTSYVTGGVPPLVYEVVATLDPWGCGWTLATFPVAGEAIALTPLAAGTISQIDLDVGTVPAAADQVQVLVYASNGSAGLSKRPSGTPVAWSKVKSTNGGFSWSANAKNTISLDGTNSPSSVAVTPTGYYLALACSSTTPTFARISTGTGHFVGRGCSMTGFTFSDSAPPSWVNTGGATYAPLLVGH